MTRHSRGREDAVTITDLTHAPTQGMPEPPRSAEEWRAAADALLRAADLRAYDLLRTALREHPDDLRLQQLIARALVQCGAIREANERLTRLHQAGHTDEETVGLLARTHKDLWDTTADAAEREAHLDAAIRFYTEAWRTTGGYWTGINAATLLAVSGGAANAEHAVDVARQVAAQCRGLLEQATGAERYWLLATLGEAALVAGNLEAAADFYTRAAATAPGVGHLVSTRRNARMLLRHAGLDTAHLDAWLPVPRVIAFAGHLIDRPSRPNPRFPAHLEAAVRLAIEQRLAAVGPAIGFAAAACGADLIFLELMRARGADTHIVLPYGPEQFVPDSVDYLPGTRWRVRFDTAVRKASQVISASDHRLGDGGMSYEYGFRVLDGEAAMHADKLDTELVCVAVWDGLPGDGPGGTASSVAHWRQAGRRVEVIDLAAVRAAYDAEHHAVAPTLAPHAEFAEAPAGGEAGTTHSAEADAARVDRHLEGPDTVGAEQGAAAHAGTVGPEPRPHVASAEDVLDAEIVGLLFADAHGFSRLSEAELPVFVSQYLGLVAAELARMPTPPLLTNTWGDGLYVVFRTVRDTGEFALRLNDAVRRTDWRALGLHDGLSLRIGLHAGPAYACTDPVTRRPNYIGAHVSRAARIEPIAPAGEVYASGAFAALARSEQVLGFSCTYVGQTPLAKGYGTFPTYVVRRVAPRRT